MRNFLLLIQFFFIGNTFAQNAGMSFEKEKTSSSLLSNSITSIAQDDTGFLWLGTEYGLARFDGYNYISFFGNEDSENSLPSNNIKRIVKTRDGNIWVATDRGIAYMDIPSGKIIKPTYCNQFKALQINTICEDTEGNLWLGTNDGVKVINPKLRRAKSIYINLNNRQSFNVNFIDVDHNGNVWIGSNYGFCAIKKITSRKLFTSHRIFGKLIFEKTRLGYFKIDTENRLWLNNNNKNISYVISRDCKLTKTTLFSTDFDGKSILIIDSQHALIGSRWNGIGLLAYSEKDNTPTLSKIWTNPKSSTDLSNTVNALFLDKTGNVWAGTKAGLYVNRKSTPSLFHNIKANKQDPRGLSHNSISSITQTKDNNLWIGTSNGLNSIKLQNEEIPTNPSFNHYYPKQSNAELSPAEMAVQCLVEDADHKLWVGTKQGIFFFDLQKNVFVQNDKISRFISENNITLTKAFYKDMQNNIWMGFTYGGLVLYSHDKGECIQIKRFKSSDVWAIAKDHFGNIWVGTHNGLFKFNSNILLSQISTSTEEYKHKKDDIKSIPSNWVTAIQVNSNGEVWIGTSEGLCKYNPKTNDFELVELTANNYPPYISGITEDLSKAIWISTPSGVYKKEKNKSIVYFELEDGYFSSINYTFGHWVTESGEIILGGTSGLYYFKPKEIVPEPTHQRVFFSQLLLPGRSFANQNINLNDLSKIELTYRDKQFSVLFSTLNFSSQPKTKYSYRIKEISNEWIYLDEVNSISFSNLPKGKYTLEVRSTTASGFWQKNPSSIQIVMLPPWWKTTVAYILYVIAFLLLLYGVFVWYRARERLLRTNELNSFKLAFYSNLLHSLRGPLSLMQSPLNYLINNHKRMQPAEIDEMLSFLQRNSKKLSHIVMKLLEFRKIDSGKLSLNLSNSDIISLVKDIHASFVELAESKQIDFTFTSSITSQKLVFDFEKIEIVLFNLLSNAFKFTNKGGKVNINTELSADKNNLIITISDTGIGISPENQKMIYERFWQAYQENPSMTKGSGMGLSLAKDFVEAHGGSILVESELNVGSSFKVMLPINNKNLSSKPIVEYDESSIKKVENIAHYVDVESEISIQELNDLEDIKKQNSIYILSFNKETLNFLFTILGKEYHVLLFDSVNKLEKKIKEHTPSIIITDINLESDSNGLELCKKIKEDNITNHIPYILLADSSTEDEKLAAYEAGADVYFERPIDADLVQIRIEQILRVRDELKEKIHQEIIINPNNVNSESQSTKFLQDVMAVVEDNIENENFTLDEFASKMNISRSKLNNKMLSLTQQSPIEFVRNIRLKRAAQLLLLEAYSVSEISYMVGISDPRYFSTIFKKQYGVSPLQYIKSEKETTKNKTDHSE